MTSSLAASIFGNIQDETVSLFEASSKLPPKPNKLEFTESKPEREKRKRNEEKKKKRKQNQEEKHTNVSETQDEEHPAEELETEDEDEQRTIFVGNQPLDIKRTALASIFKSCGKVNSARIRSVATAGVKVAPEHAGNQVR